MRFLFNVGKYVWGNHKEEHYERGFKGNQQVDGVLLPRLAKIMVGISVIFGAGRWNEST